MSSLQGQTFAGYEIIAKLGQGGMGAVFKARQPNLDRFAALKIMASELANDPDFVARFKREAAAAANLSHPNIVQVYSAGESEGTHYIAMEFVDGETVKQHIESQGRLDPREAIAITVFVAEALQYGWNKAKLIHRDIKPDNIFLSKSGEVKVGDLGLAKTVGGATTNLTQTGMMMGSPHYISPEQARGVSDIDFRTDIYSLGCTIFHMLTGRPPYEGPDPLSVITKHVNDPPPAIFKSWPGCPVPLALVLGKMLAKRPHERPASYEDLIEQLREVHDKLKPATVAAPVSASEPTQILTPTPAPAPAQPTPKPVVAKATPPRPAPAAKPARWSSRFSVLRSDRLKPELQRAMLYAAAGVAAIAVIAGAVWWFAGRAPADEFKPLFNGKDLTGWKVREGNRSDSWDVRDGALVNTEPKTYLVSEETFGDFEFHCEYRLNEKGDGGVYLRGLYQIQFVPDAGKPTSTGSSGAIHELIAPTENAAKGADEWQTLDAKLVGKRVTVILNGRRVIEDGELARATKLSLNIALDAPGPIMLQGHLGTCEYRNIRIKPLGASPPAAPVATAAQQPRQTIDLLALTDPVSDRIMPRNLGKANTWERRGRSLAYVSDGKAGKVAAPVAIRARSYEIEVEFERLSGRGHFHVDLPLEDGRIIPIYLDCPDGKLIAQREGAGWPTGRAGRGRVVVRLDRGVNGAPDRFSARLDDETLSDWQGNITRFAMSPEPYPLFPGQPLTSIFCFSDSYEIRAWQLRIFDGEATVLRGGDTQPVAERASVRTDAADRTLARSATDNGWQNAVNLLPLIDPQKDTVAGEWTFEKGELISNKINYSRIEIPYQPPEEYDYLVEFSGNGIGGCQLLAKAGREFRWACFARNVFAFDTVNGMDIHVNATRREMFPMERGRHYVSMVEVRNNGLQAFLDGQLVTAWPTTYADMNVPERWKLRGSGLLGVGSQAPTIFHRIEVREVTGKGTFTRPAP